MNNKYTNTNTEANNAAEKIVGKQYQQEELDNGHLDVLEATDNGLW